jgi:serine/threonine-protein kinase HipA
MLAFPSLGESAVLELLRRILVSDLLGNPDMHLKNMGLRYTDGRAPELSPAYDIVAYAAFGNVSRSRALPLVPSRAATTKYAVDTSPPLNAVNVRDFCARLGLPERPARTALKQCESKAFETWPALIEQSCITDKMKKHLLRRLQEKRSLIRSS